MTESVQLVIPVCKNTYSEGHTVFLQNISATFTDKTDLQNLEKMENYWTHTLKTMVPWDLNILNSV